MTARSAQSLRSSRRDGRPVVTLGSAESVDVAVTGAKAARLARSLRSRLPVLPGFVVPTDADRDDLHRDGRGHDALVAAWRDPSSNGEHTENRPDALVPGTETVVRFDVDGYDSEQPLDQGARRCGRVGPPEREPRGPGRGRRSPR